MLLHVAERPGKPDNRSGEIALIEGHGPNRPLGRWTA
jgi:hypothetical protein